MEIISRKKARELGFKFYFTGKLCPNNHIGKRTVSGASCYECKLNLQKTKYANSVAEKERCRQIRDEAKLRGDLYYSTGVKCKQGHLTKRRTNSGNCINCEIIGSKKTNIRSKNKYKNDPNYREKVLAKNNERYKQADLESRKLRKIRSKRANDKNRKNPSFRLNASVSCAVRNTLKSGKEGKSYRDFVSFTLDQLIRHLELKFTPEMTWENYGSYWHLDHIRPVSWFDLTKKEEFDKCWALTNLQPLWKIDNIRKGNRYEG